MAYYYTVEVESLERLNIDELMFVKNKMEAFWPRPIGKANIEFIDCEGDCGICVNCKSFPE